MEVNDIEYEQGDFFQYKERKGKELLLPVGPDETPDLRRGELLAISNTYGFIVAGTKTGVLFDSIERNKI